jgi:hypothetical protein
MTSAEGPHVPQPLPSWRRLFACLTLVALVTLPCWGLPLFLLGQSVYREWRDHIPFNSEAWKEAEHLEVRYHMSWDLVHGNVLKGKTTDEVEGLLGKPGTKDVFSDNPTMPKFSTPHFERGVETWYYSLGAEWYEFSIGPSGAILAVDFKNGKVFDVRKVVH